MKIFFVLLFTFNLSAKTTRVFQPVPIEEAHSYFGEASDNELDSSSLNVFIWNVKKASIKGWSEAFKAFAHHQDLILIQEAYRNQYFENTLLLFKNIRWDMGTSFITTIDASTPTGTMIGSRTNPQTVTVLHSPDFEPIIQTPKSTTLATYPLRNSEQDLLVVSIHGINLTNDYAFMRHLNQIRAEISKHDGPIIFAGDFNTRTMTRLIFTFQLAHELGLNPANFVNGHLRMMAPLTDNILDHAFIRGLKIKKAEVIASPASDHNPMFLELALD